MICSYGEKRKDMQNDSEPALDAQNRHSSLLEKVHRRGKGKEASFGR